VLALHCILLPVNVTRLLQIERARSSGRRLLARTAGPTPEQDRARPIFLAHQALADPATALILAEHEQERVAGMLSSRLCGPAATEHAPAPDATGRAARMLLDDIDQYLVDLATAGAMSAEHTTHLAHLRSRDEALRALHETLGELAAWLRGTPARPPDSLAATVREGLGAILLIAEDAARSPGDIDLLLRMTFDRGTLVEHLRAEATASQAAGDADSHRAVYAVTALYERSVWLLQRYARLLETAAAEQAACPTP
jgi:phosphate:Na+ symporter